MAPAISEVVSTLFYEGRLMVAQNARADPYWSSIRQPVIRDGFEKENNIFIIQAHENGKYSPKNGGICRFESGELIRTLIDEIHHKEMPGTLIAVLTPFRANRRSIANYLGRETYKDVLVGTVHSMQGMERQIIIFDPAMGDNDFLKGKNGMRLINVALSRAQAQLYLILSKGDLNNPIFREIQGIISKKSADPENRTPTAPILSPKQTIKLEDAHRISNFPNCLMGQWIEATHQKSRVIGKVIGIHQQGKKINIRTQSDQILTIDITRVAYGLKDMPEILGPPKKKHILRKNKRV